MLIANTEALSLLSIDLSQSWTNATVMIHSSAKPDGVPILNQPSLWYHEQEDLLYSGFTGSQVLFNNPPELPPDLPPLSLWTFKPDGTGGGSWNELISSNSSANESVWNSMSRPAGALMAYDADSAWVLGGWRNGPLPGMIHFDMMSKSFENTSAANSLYMGMLADGAMQYVPTFGPQGIFVSMGGEVVGYEDNAPVDFGTVSIFDPARKEWWNQTTTGEAPNGRGQFCAAGIGSTNGTFEM